MKTTNRLHRALSETQRQTLSVANLLKALEGAVIALMPLTAAYCLWQWQTAPSLTPIYISICIFFGLLLLRALLAWPAAKGLYGTVYQGTLQMRMQILQHLIALPMGSFKILSAGKIAQTLSEDMVWFESYHSFSKPYRMGDLITIFILVGVSLFISWPMALAYIGLVTIGFTVLGYLKKKTAVGFELRSKGLSDAAQHIMEFAQGMPIIRAFGDNDEAEKNFQKYIDILREGFRKSVLKNAPFTTLFSSFVTLGVSAAAIAGTFVFDWQDPSTFFVYVITLILLSATIAPTQSFLAYTLMGNLSKISEQNVAEIESVAPMPSGQSETLEGPIEINFENVSFSYDTDETAVEAISFKAEPGSVNAIVGKSGSGKSTLMNLLLRFWDPTQGQILVNGEDIRSFKIGFWHDHISTVFQETILFKDTIANNIRVGRPDASDEEVREAAKLAHIIDMIESLDKGFDTIVGVGGARLSGGEKQRIAIARAILKDAPIVILDEATSALDPENENQIQAAFSGLAKHKTVFVIAHRLSTIVNADNILLLDDGKLIHQGKHDELLANSRIYKNLWDKHTHTAGWSIKS